MIKENNNKETVAVDKPEIKAEENKTKDVDRGAAQAVAKSVYGERKRGRRQGRKPTKKDDDFEQRILDLARVTRVIAGGKRMRFRVCVAIGDKKGKVGIGMGKGADVAMAVNKAVNKAKKNIIDVPIVKDTIPHEFYFKTGAAKILFKPAQKGRGVIAGGVVRIIFELAGVQNVSAKILGTNNKVNNAKCTIEALRRLKRVEVKNKDNNKEVEKESEKDKNYKS